MFVRYWLHGFSHRGIRLLLRQNFFVSQDVLVPYCLRWMRKLFIIFDSWSIFLPRHCGKGRRYPPSLLSACPIRRVQHGSLCCRASFPIWGSIGAEAKISRQMDAMFRRWPSLEYVNVTIALFEPLGLECILYKYMLI